MGGFRVGIEIPLLSWSLHLLGEAEWAGGGRVSGPRGFSMARPPLSFHSSVEGCAVVGGSESRWGVFLGVRSGLLREVSAVFRGLRLAASILGRNNSVTRSGLRTVSDGEFDWGGTSFKR